MSSMSPENHGILRILSDIFDQSSSAQHGSMSQGAPLKEDLTKKPFEPGTGRGRCGDFTEAMVPSDVGLETP